MFADRSIFPSISAGPGLSSPTAATWSAAIFSRSINAFSPATICLIVASGPLSECDGTSSQSLAMGLRFWSIPLTATLVPPMSTPM